MKKKKGLLIVLILILGIGFATVTTTLYLNGNVNISVNNEDFDVKFTSAVIDNEDKTSTVISEDGKTINFTTKELVSLNDKSVLDFEVTNNSSLYDAEVSIDCTSENNNSYYQITKEVASTISAKTTESGSIEVKKIELVSEDIEENFTCTLTVVAKERATKGKLIVNKNIVNKNLECLQNKSVGSCEAGTEIKYMVNDSEERTFYVLHDDLDTITMQDSTNVVENVIWYSTDGNTKDNTKGPLTALTAIESATSGWDNVNIQTYIMGTTRFNGTNPFTGCNVNATPVSCTTNAYTLGERSARARIITAQEAFDVGCTVMDNSCPSWLLPTKAYWTMTAALTGNTHSLAITNTKIQAYWTIQPSIGARAVIEVNKYN